jgi:hypothetical protein
MALVIFMSDGFADYKIVRSTINCGGGTSSSGQYRLTGTIGQPIVDYSSGDNYEILSGFWFGGTLCFVEFDDFVRFAQYWLLSGSNLPADLDDNGSVDIYDLKEFVYDWLCVCPYDWPLK